MKKNFLFVPGKGCSASSHPHWFITEVSKAWPGGQAEPIMTFYTTIKMYKLGFTSTISVYYHEAIKAIKYSVKVPFSPFFYHRSYNCNTTQSNSYITVTTSKSFSENTFEALGNWSSLQAMHTPSDVLINSDSEEHTVSSINKAEIFACPSHIRWQDVLMF